VKAEVPWIQMWHMGAPVPRLVHIQGDREIPSAGAAAGSGGGCTYTPLYRHPTDLSPAVEAWTPAVRAIAQLVSKKLGRTYNQALVQLYRSGKDAISEHADKTLDIEHGAPIVGVSLGASRTFTLRSKARLKANTGPQSVQHIALPDSSVYVLGLETNRTFTHQIAADKNPPGNRRPDENAFGGERISITLRCVASYLRSDGRVFGQGDPDAFTRFRPYLAHFFPVFPRFLRVFTVSTRRFQRAQNRNPGPRDSGKGAQTPFRRPS